MITVNHYARTGFRAWWLVLAISAIVPEQIHWVTTAAWNYPDPVRRRLLTPATRWAFRRVAQVYGFTCMPPMPPHPSEVVARAIAVRRVIAYVRQTALPLVGLAPEGRDNTTAGLQSPPPGVGRFMLHLAQMGLEVVPVGAYESLDSFCLHFGEPYFLEVSPGSNADDCDRQASRIVMDHIADLLPSGMRGEFGRQA